MTDDDITPDRLRLAGWDDDGRAVFTRDDAPDARIGFCDWCQRWHWRTTHSRKLADPTGMADIAARLAVSTVHTPN